MILGVIVNPVAGVGGPAGLKGTDGEEILNRALQAGVSPKAGERAVRALSQLANEANLEIVTGPGPLGADAAALAGLDDAHVQVLPLEPTGSGRDTISLAKQMAEQGVDLILFVGGDGTARDVAAGIEDTSTPILGVPAGVKMYSGCFGLSPESAGQMSLHPPHRTRVVEILDVDEEQVRTGRVDPKLFALAEVPDDSAKLQRRKVATVASDRDAVEAVARGLVEQMQPGVTYLVGPGGTTATVLDRLGLRGTPLGVDAVRDGAIVARDVSQDQALDLVRTAPGPAKAIIGVIGGQGFVLGRGNQQLSADVVNALADSDPQGGFPLLVGATQSKLLDLLGKPLLVDTGDPLTDRKLAGPIRVQIGPGNIAMYTLASAERM